jgi:hypothetical protein
VRDHQLLSWRRLGADQRERRNRFLAGRLDTLVYLQRQVYGEHKSWPEFHERMAREKRVIIRIAIDTAGPQVRG